MGSARKTKNQLETECVSCSKYEKELRELKSRLSDQADRIEDLDAQIADLKDLLSQQKNPSPSHQSFPSPDQIKSVVADAVAEELEKARCRKALVISGMPESDGTEPEVQGVQDHQKVESLLEELGVNSSEIEGVYHMPSYDEETDARTPTRPRQIKIKLRSGHWQKIAVEKAKAVLKDTDTFSGVYVNPSRTYAQRKFIKSAKREVGRINANGGNVYFNYSRMEILHSSRPKTSGFAGRRPNSGGEGMGLATASGGRVEGRGRGQPLKE